MLISPEKIMLSTQKPCSYAFSVKLNENLIASLYLSVHWSVILVIDILYVVPCKTAGVVVCAVSHILLLLSIDADSLIYEKEMKISVR